MTATIVQSNEKDLARYAFAIQQLAEGRSNATGTVTLTASAASTTVSSPTCGSGSVVLLMPMTANASAALATSYVATVNAGSFVITHASNSQTDRTFGFICLG